MNRLLLASLLASFSICSNAQLQVDSYGCTNTKSLFANPSSSGYLQGYALYGRIYNHAFPTAIGVKGYAFAKSSDNVTTRVAIGVRGEAMNAIGRNYGVYGVVQPVSSYINYGAAIYGTCSGSTAVLSANYAGYFDGLVKVTGMLQVSGGIHGTLLSASASSFPTYTQIPLSPERKGSMDISNQIRLLRVGTFYPEVPDPVTMITLPSEDEKDPLVVDSIHLSARKNQMVQEGMIRPLSSMEKQVLSKQHYGLDADQLEEVFPGVVYECEDGTKGINYVEMVPILVQAINELSEKIAALENDGRKMVRTTTETAPQAEGGQLLFLGQNTPNPFYSQTSVELTIPDDVQTAFLYVYDLNGKKLQQVDITDRGKQSVKLSSTGLEEGMYLYSLIADGKVVQTRRMIVEK